MDLDDVVPLHLDTDPPVARGCSHAEITAIIVGSFIAALPLSALIALLFGNLVLMTGMVLGVTIGLAMLGTTVMRSIKRSRPNYYFMHMLLCWMHRKGIRRRRDLLLRSGMWDVDRTSEPPPPLKQGRAR